MRYWNSRIANFASNIAGLVAIGLLVTHFVYGIPGDWYLIALVTQTAAWAWDPRLRMQRTPTGRVVEDFRKYLIMTVTLWPPCLLVGWIVDKIAEAQGTWPVKAAWLSLCVILFVCGALRRWNNAVIVSDKGE